MNKEEGVPVAKPPEAAALSNVCLLMPKEGLARSKTGPDA